MKRSHYLCFLLIINFSALSQNNEFPIYSNGLIYDSTTMYHLGEIVDSLNLQFKSCDLNKTYYGLDQGYAYVIDVASKSIAKLIKNNIPIDEFIRDNPTLIKGSKVWLYKKNYTNQKGDNYILYSGLPKGYNTWPKISVKSIPKNDKTKGWVLDQNSQTAIYLEQLDSYSIPNKYARHVQYVDCMIDTAASIYYPNAEFKTFQEIEPNSTPYVFVQWVNSFPNKPQFPDYKSDNFNSQLKKYNEQYSRWDSLKMVDLDKKMRRNQFRKSQLMDAYEEAIVTGNSDPEFEYYVSRYLSPAHDLNLKRRRKVRGYCSMDSSPRVHAMKISTLAASTGQWDIFLRSHLDIMNDRFDRQSDGSYAYGARKTYIKELELLKIDVNNLLIGTSLRTSNTHENHYIGSIGRLGRALAESKYKSALEEELFEMISSDNLDPFNKLLMAFLLDNYNHHLDDEMRKNKNEERMELLISKWPYFLKEIWHSN